MSNSESDSPRWLDDHEQQLWRAWLARHAHIRSEMQRDLRAGGELSEPDYEVLVYLTDGDEGVRIGELARRLKWEKSRLSHQVGRMERRGLIAREECPSDKRGQIIVATDAGRRAIMSAAPSHVAVVRRAFVDRLDARDRADLARILTTLAQDEETENHPQSAAASQPAAGNAPSPELVPAGVPAEAEHVAVAS